MWKFLILEPPYEEECPRILQVRTLLPREDA